jgi:hypothetical protein
MKVRGFDFVSFNNGKPRSFLLLLRGHSGLDCLGSVIYKHSFESKGQPEEDIKLRMMSLLACISVWWDVAILCLAILRLALLWLAVILSAVLWLLVDSCPVVSVYVISKYVVSSLVVGYLAKLLCY